MEKHHAAERAIQAMGPDVIPVLTERLRLSADSLDHEQDMHTISAFRALGSKARPAVLTLVELLSPSYDAARESLSDPRAELADRKSTAAAIALRAIGQASVSPLIEALTGDDRKIRFGAAMALARFRRHAKDVVPALIKAFDDKDIDVRWRAVRSVGTLRALPELSIPALAERMRKDPETSVRIYAVWALVKFGKQAESSLEDFTTAAPDSDHLIRSYAKQALKAIASAGATNDRAPKK